MFRVKNNELVPSSMKNCPYPFLWDYFSWAKKKVLVVGVPFMYPAPKVNGAFITGRFVPKVSSYPEDLASNFDLAGYLYDDLPEEDFVDEILSKGSRVIASKMISDLRNRVSTSLSLFDSQQWDLVVLIDSLPDDLFHVAFDQNDLLDEMFTVLDNWLAEIWRRLNPDTDSLLIASDHGFSSLEGVFFLNEWLFSHAYLKMPKSRLFAKPIQMIGLDQDSVVGRELGATAYGILKRLPWASGAIKTMIRKSVFVDRLHPDPGTTAIGLNNSEAVAWIRILSEKSDMVPANSIYEQLTALVKTGLIKQVMRSNDVYRGSCVANAPGQVLVEAKEGWIIDTARLNAGRMIGKPTFSKKGAHRREGIFAYLGKNTVAHNLDISILDVTPSILNALGLPLPDHIDGIPVIKKFATESGPWKLHIPEPF